MLYYNSINNRINISPVIGCIGDCMYCYVQKNDKIKIISDNEVDDIKNKLQILDNNDIGKYGSLISIGAFGDPFLNEKSYQKTLTILQDIVNFLNPIQIASKFSISKDKIKQLADLQKYDNQILFSTSVSSFKFANIIEKNTPLPEERMKMLSLFRSFNINTNLMIKPFLPGITDLEKYEFLKVIKDYSINNVVVGVFYWNKEIIERLQKNKLKVELGIYSKHSLPCEIENNYFTFNGNRLDDFVGYLKNNKVNVFKNPGCITAKALKINHFNNMNYKDDLYLCMKCGNCKTTSS